MIAHAEYVLRFIKEETCAQGKSAPDPLCRSYKVGYNSVVLVGKEFTRSAVAALHFVADKKYVVFPAVFGKLFYKRFIERIHAALALHAFDHHGASLILRRPFDRLYIRFRIRRFGHKGIEILVIAILSRSGKRKERSSVETPVQRDNSRPALTVFREGIFSCRFKSALVDFRARISEKHAFCARLFAQKFCKLRLRLGIIKITRVLNPVELGNNGALPFLVVHAEDVYPDSRAEIDIFPARLVPKRSVFAARERDVKTRINLRAVL